MGIVQVPYATVTVKYFWRRYIGSSQQLELPMNVAGTLIPPNLKPVYRVIIFSHWNILFLVIGTYYF